MALKLPPGPQAEIQGEIHAFRSRLGAATRSAAHVSFIRNGVVSAWTRFSLAIGPRMTRNFFGLNTDSPTRPRGMAVITGPPLSV